MENPKINKDKGEDNNSLIQTINDYKAKAKNYINNNPKNIFICMIALTIISLIGNLLYYKITLQKEKVSYRQASEQLLNRVDRQASSINKKQEAGIVQQAENYWQMKQDLDKLKEYQMKKNLNAQDSADVKRIVQKYNLQ